MRVLHLISSGGMYGAEAVILNLSRVLNSSGEHRSVIAAFVNQGAENLQLQQAAAQAGVEAHPVPCRGQLDRSVPGRLRELVRSVGADVVHAHGYKADVYALWAFHSTRTPLVSTCHTWYDNDLAVRLYGALDRAVLRRFGGVVAVSDEVRDRLLRAGVQVSRVRVIRNGVDLRPFAVAGRRRAERQQAPAPLRVGLVGRLAPEKGVDLFLHAAATLLGEGLAAEYVVAGDGPERTALEQQLAQLQAAGHVRLLGQVSDMAAFYASLDVLVSASRQEGLPIALLEGLASGLPTIATAVGSVPEVILPERTGLLIAPNDAQVLAASMRRLVQDRALRQLLGEAGQQFIADHFSAERMTAEYLELYRSVAGPDTA